MGTRRFGLADDAMGNLAGAGKDGGGEGSSIGNRLAMGSRMTAIGRCDD